MTDNPPSKNSTCCAKIPFQRYASINCIDSGPFQPSENWLKNQLKILSQMSHFLAEFCRRLEQPQNITQKKCWYGQWLGMKIPRTSKHKHHANSPWCS
jgi:hypothetical protein